MIRKKILIFIFLIATIGSLSAQDDFYRDEPGKKSNSIMDRFQFGAGAGLQFGNPTLIELSPKLTFMVTDKLTTGLGISYFYYRERDPGGIYQTSVYGGSLFSNYLLFSNIFAHVEYEKLNFIQYDNIAQEYNRKWIGSFFVGGGYRQYFNNHTSYMQLMMLYNLNFQTNSPYSSPLVTRVQIFF